MSKVGPVTEMRAVDQIAYSPVPLGHVGVHRLDPLGPGDVEDGGLAAQLGGNPLERVGRDVEGYE
jgi:hypothetical protein